MAKKSYEGPSASLELYEAAVATIPGLDRKGAANPYTSRNGHMFSYLDKVGVLAVRLPADKHEQFLDEFDSAVPESHGAKMKEYVVIPDDMLAQPAEAGKWLAASYEWIGTLKPKATKRKATKAK